MTGAGQRSLTVLVAATAAADADALLTTLRAAGIEAEPVTSVDELCRQITRDDAAPGAIVVVDEALSGGGARALDRALQAQPSWSDLPVVVVLAGGDGGSSALEALGHVTILQRPMRAISLVSVVRSALHDRGRQYDIRDHLRALAQASEHKDMLLGELAHRVKNTLAVIQAIVAETRRTSSDMDDFVGSLEGRLH